MSEKKFIPDFHFGFRDEHPIKEQVRKLVRQISAGFGLTFRQWRKANIMTACNTLLAVLAAAVTLSSNTDPHRASLQAKQNLRLLIPPFHQTEN